jgi:hypothetical protein
MMCGSDTMFVSLLREVRRRYTKRKKIYGAADDCISREEM